MDPSLVAAPSIDIVGVVAASREAQVGARPVVPSKPAQCHMDMGLVAVHLVTVEAAPLAAPRSFIPSPVALGKVTTSKRSSRYVDLLAFLFLAFIHCIMIFSFSSWPLRTCHVSS